MTESIQSNTDSQLINMLLQYGLAEGMPTIAPLILNEAMLIKRSQHIHSEFEYTSSQKCEFSILSLYVGKRFSCPAAAHTFHC